MLPNTLSGLFEEIFKLSKVKASEKAVIILPQIYDQRYFEAASTALNNLGADFYSVIIPHVSGKQKLDLPSSEFVYNSVGEADFILTLEQSCYVPQSPAVFKFIYRSEKHRGKNEDRYLEKGKSRCLSVTITEPAMRRLWPTDNIINRCKSGAAFFDKGKEIRLTSEMGTDLTMNKKGMPGVYEAGVADSPGRWDNFGYAMVATVPIEGTANGKLVIEAGDYLVSLGTFVSENITCEIKDGYIKEIKGGASADYLRRYFEWYKDPEAYALAHIGWGAHDGAIWSPRGGRFADETFGYVIDRYNYYGSIPIAFGWTLGKNTDSHIDINLLNHDLILDGEIICSKGKIIHPECK